MNSEFFFSYNDWSTMAKKKTVYHTIYPSCVNAMKGRKSFSKVSLWYVSKTKEKCVRAIKRGKVFQCVYVLNEFLSTCVLWCMRTWNVISEWCWVKEFSQACIYILKGVTMMPPSGKYIKLREDDPRGRFFWWLFGFYDIPTFVGYLMPNPFYTNNQFYFKQFRLAWVHSLIVKNISISSYSI